MSKNRYVDTHFWDDTYIITLDPIEKLLFIYSLTNPLTNICGIYEISLKRIAFDTGIDKDTILKIFSRFENENKMKYLNGWIAIKNFIKNQKINPNIKIGIECALLKAPKELVEWCLKAFESLSNPFNYLNSNLNPNTNSNPKERKELHNYFIDYFYKKYEEIHKIKFKFTNNEIGQIKNILSVIKTKEEIELVINNAFSDDFWFDKVTPTNIYKNINKFRIKTGAKDVSKNDFQQNRGNGESSSKYEKFTSKLLDMPEVQGDWNNQHDRRGNEKEMGKPDKNRT